MAIVEITAVQGSAPIRIEVVGLVDKDFYENRETRGIVTKPVTAIARQLYVEAIGLASSCAVQTRQQLDAMAEGQARRVRGGVAMNVDMEVGAKIVNLDSGRPDTGAHAMEPENRCLILRYFVQSLLAALHQGRWAEDALLGGSRGRLRDGILGRRSPAQR